MRKPLVSILVPAYNAGRWLSAAVASAKSQTWGHTEIIIVDDGSSDNTLSVAREFAGPRVLVLRQENQGAASARNYAYSVCQGDYVQWLDADDVLACDKIERQVRALDTGLSPRRLLSGPWAYFRYRPHKAVFRPSPLWTSLSSVEWLTRKMSHAIHMQTSTWLVSRELSDDAGPWDATLWRDNDGEYFCRVLMKSSGVYFVDDARCYYRSIGLASISHTGSSDRKLESLCRSIKLHVHYLLSMENSERTRSACISYMGAWCEVFYPYRRDLAEELGCVVEGLGGHATEPRLTRHYQWLVDRLGWNTARKVQYAVSRAKHGLANSWDKAMLQFEKLSHS